jgi:6-phosphogluconolactonase
VTLFVGTYTEKLPHVLGQGDGIDAAEFDSGQLGDVKKIATLANPSWLVLDSARRRMYAVSETLEFDGKTGGGVAGFEWEPDGDRLTPLNFVASAGEEPAHLAVDPSGRYLLVANYGSGTIAVFRIDDAGGIGDRTDLVQHSGGTPGSIRQSSSHPHHVVFDPITRHVLVADLGLDAIVVYELSTDGRLTELTSSVIRVEAGFGPRHIAFSPSGRHLFVVGELSSTLAVFLRTGGQFVRSDSQSTLPSGFAGHNQPAAIVVSVSGEFVFVSNRGHDSIAMFRFHPEAGTLALVRIVPSGGAVPRDIAQSPDGHFLLVANQDSDSIVSFEIDEVESTLTFVAERTVLTPVCLLFGP